MLNFTNLEAAVAKEATVTDSVILLLQTLAQALLDNPANQAEVEKVATDMNDLADKLAAAVTANTPPTP